MVSGKPRFAILLAALFASTLALAAGAQQGGTFLAPAYDEVVAAARSLGETPPSPLAFRLVLRFAAPGTFDGSGTDLDLMREADLELRFGLSPQEAGLRIRRMSAALLDHGARGGAMNRLLLEERRRMNLPASFGGPERGAGRIGAGIAASLFGAASSQAAGIGQAASGGVSGGGQGSGGAHSLAGDGLAQ